MAIVTSWTMDDLVTIETAIATGARSITFGSGPSSRSVTYGSIDDLLRVRMLIRTALGLSGQPKTYLVAHNRGFQPLLGDDIFESEKE